jgi:predicted DNA-binding transcriptional regulator YafY
MYHPASRLLTLLELLQAEPTLTGAALARRLEVDVRTVRRYVGILQDMGVPIEAVIGRAGGYRLRPGYKLPPLMLTDDEAVAVTVGLLMVDRLGIDGGVVASAGALAKLQRVLPPAVRERVGALAENLVLDLASAEASITRVILATLASAAQQQRQARIVYEKASAVRTERVIDPFGVVFHAGRWYCVGHCHLRGDTRIFRLDRIHEATLLPTSFSRPPGFDSHAHLLRTIAAIPDVWDVSVLLDIDLSRAQRHLPPALVQLEAAPPYLRLRASVNDLRTIAQLLAGLGCPLVVEQPDELRAELRALASALLEAVGQ